PILEVGAVASAVAWMAAFASDYCIKPHLIGGLAALFGLVVTSLLVLVKVVPVVPGHFTRHEWIALAIWAVLGLMIRVPGERQRQKRLIEPTAESVSARK